MALLSSILGSTFKGDAASYPIYTVSQPQLAYAVYPTTVFNSSGTTLANTGTGTFTWTCPAGVTKVKATVISGGGGAGAAVCGWGPPSSGGYAIGIYTVTPGTVYTITAGAGGAGNATNYGGAGGSSSFSSFCSATGGGGSLPSATSVAGVGVNGNLRNTSIVPPSLNPSISNAIPIFGDGTIYNTNSATSQVSWSPSGANVAGLASRLSSAGGTSGVVCLEWIS